MHRVAERDFLYYFGEFGLRRLVRLMGNHVQGLKRSHFVNLLVSEHAEILRFTERFAALCAAIALLSIGTPSGFPALDPAIVAPCRDLP